MKPTPISSLGLFALAVLLAALPALAHHSFAAEYDGSRTLRLAGAVTQIDWSNPHVYFFLDVKDRKGTIANWACEAAGPGPLTRRGWRKGDVKPGETLTVEGYPAKDGSHRIDALRITLPDGRVVAGKLPADE